ncbi:RelA/SpoT family protein [Patescibacteria group bacterium]|nr:RelA/SpoT family protein [Patescibacteria group bacterium]
MPQQEPDKRIQILIDTMKHADPSERKQIAKAFEFSKQAHEGTLRASGEPYFIHLFETSKILAEIGMDSTTIIAGLLHDIIEDTDVSKEEIEKEFGKDVLFLIEGVTKLGKLKYRGLKRHTESLRKFFIATSQDIRVLIIRLADRLHNMRTLKYLSREKQIRKSNEVLEIFSPLAYRLGMRVIHKELEDIAFSFINPEEYQETLELLKKRKKRDMKFLEKFNRSLKKALAKEKITKINTSFRVKGLYSLYKKLNRKDGDIEKIYDITAMRIITDSVGNCYKILGIIHGTWKPLPGRLKDYIALPKPNGYQSIHTTIFTGDGGIVEIQIRTKEMHDIAEMGVASHLVYKGNKAGDILSQMMWIKNLIPGVKKEVETPEIIETVAPVWIKELGKEFDKEEESEDLLEEVRTDFFEHRVFAFTPNGDVIDLPVGASPIDFAYAIHTHIGSHLSGAKVNGKMTSLDTELENGDIVEIITKKTITPTRKWLEMVKTSEARRNIKAKLKINKSD